MVSDMLFMYGIVAVVVGVALSFKSPDSSGFV